jgi:hypothetical protein
MSLEDAENLLPSIPKHSLWSEADEAQLQQSWTDEDEECLTKDTNADTEEQALWALILCTFRQHPHQLFKYGLKHSSGEDGEDGEAGERGPYMSEELCEALQMLLCHPLWWGDLAPVRYLLQEAIALRVPGHIKQIGPMRVPEEAKGPMQALKSSLDMDHYRHLLVSAYNSPKYIADPHIQKLCEQLKKTVKKDDLPAGEENGEGTSVEQMLFVLESRDVDAVMNALDSNLLHSSLYPKTCVEYFEGYQQWIARTPFGPLLPADTETLKEWKKACHLAIRRDWIVSVRRWEHGIGQGAEHWVGDVDPSDSYPEHFDCGELLGITPAHEKVLRGLIWPLSTEDEPVMLGP